MKIRILGGGFYGCHLAMTLRADGHKVELHEKTDRLFNGASGNIPARIHEGYHYPRSKKTRDACQAHIPAFMQVYGQFTRGVETNIYAIAADHSMVDYEQYVDSLSREVSFHEIDPASYGLRNVEGAILTQERHIVTDDVRVYFEEQLKDVVIYNSSPEVVNNPHYDLTIDCTFCANDSRNIDRYEPCVVGLLAGPTDTAITIMDGPFASLYPWNEDEGLCSLSSAKWTPFSKTCDTYEDANFILGRLSIDEINARVEGMFNDLCRYYPTLDKYLIKGSCLSIRAMPLSGADARLVDVVKVGPKAVRVRAGKIDAVVAAEDYIKNKVLKDLK